MAKAVGVGCPSQLREGVEQQADTVFLKPEELERLRSEYGDEAAERIIVLLDAYKTKSPEKMQRIPG